MNNTNVIMEQGKFYKQAEEMNLLLDTITDSGLVPLPDSYFLTTDYLRVLYDTQTLGAQAVALDLKWEDLPLSWSPLRVQDPVNFLNRPSPSFWKSSKFPPLSNDRYTTTVWSPMVAALDSTLTRLHSPLTLSGCVFFESQLTMAAKKMDAMPASRSMQTNLTIFLISKQLF